MAVVRKKTRAPAPAPKVRRGRPRRDEIAPRLEDLLDVAARVFVRDGYAAATMAKIAREAGASNKTLYARYRNKAELLVAVGARLTGPSVEALAAAMRGAASPLGALEAVFWQVGRHWMQPTELGLLRMVIAESPRTPQLADVFRRAIAPFEELLAGYLAELVAAGILATDEPAAFGLQLIHLAVGEVRDRALLGDTPTEADLARDIARALTLVGPALRG